MINIDHLKVQFGKFIAVDGFCLEAAPAQVFGFLGPNGAGKTTTVRVLTGVLRPTSGTVTINGHLTPNQLDKVKGLCGYVPDTDGGVCVKIGSRLVTEQDFGAMQNFSRDQQFFSHALGVS